MLPLALTLMASSNSVTSQITTSSSYQCILTSRFGPLMYTKELCKFRWRIAVVPLSHMHKSLGFNPALQQMRMTSWGAYLNHGTHYITPQRCHT